MKETVKNYMDFSPLFGREDNLTLREIVVQLKNKPVLEPVLGINLLKTEDNLLDFILGYKEKLSRRPPSTFTEEQIEFALLSQWCNANLKLQSDENAQKLIRSEMKDNLFTNLEHSKLFLKLLFLENETYESVVADQEKLRDLFMLYEGNAAALSKKACNLIDSELQPPLKELPNDEKIEFLTNVARLYSPGFLMGMGEYQILNWINFCQELRILAKDSRFVNEVCLYDPVRSNKNLARFNFNYLESASLLWAEKP